MLEKYGVGEFFRAGLAAVVQQGLVVAMIFLPLDDGLGCDALAAQMNARHVIRAVDEKEQREGEQVHPDQDRDGIEYAADDVTDHRAASERPCKTTAPPCRRPASIRRSHPRTMRGGRPGASPEGPAKRDRAAEGTPATAHGA